MHWSANTDTLLSKYPIYVYAYDICKYTNELYTQTIIYIYIYTESCHQRMSFLVYLCFRIQHWSIVCSHSKYERAWQQVQTRGICRSSWRTKNQSLPLIVWVEVEHTQKTKLLLCVVSCRIHQSACLWSCSWRCSGNPREFGSLQACTICRPHWSLILPSGLALFAKKALSWTASLSRAQSFQSFIKQEMLWEKGWASYIHEALYKFNW